MTNLDPHPDERELAPAPPHCPDGARVEIITSREVPLGGPRAMTVRRTLPQRQRSLIGAWCFVDHYGPDDVSATGGMDVAPHPHTGLQTVTWLFEGNVTHHDSGGNHAVVLPGEVNLMTAGTGICHSEVSTQDTTVLHGVQLWTVLPDSDRQTGRRFDHHAPETVPFEGGQALVFMGSLLGYTSPITTFTPLLGAELRLDPGAELLLDVDPEYEHGLLLDTGDVELEGVAVAPTELAYTGIGETRLRLRNTGGVPARMVLIGGPPLYRGGGDVVELHRPQSRGDRPVPPGMAGPRGAIRPHPGLCQPRPPGNGPASGPDPAQRHHHPTSKPRATGPTRREELTS